MTEVTVSIPFLPYTFKPRTFCFSVFLLSFSFYPSLYISNSTRATSADWNWSRSLFSLVVSLSSACLFLPLSLSFTLSVSLSASVNALWPHLICTHLHFGALCKCCRAHFVATSRHRKVTPRCGQQPLLHFTPSLSLLPLCLSLEIWCKIST